MDKNNKKIHIQLGDVIQIFNPTNDVLNEQQFFIDYIDKSKVILININTLNKVKQKIDENGIIGNGTIETIKIIYRNPNSGYARQNNLVSGNWINIHFGGDIPSIIVAKITNLEEDMIEITTIDNDLLFINFDYKGIPEELPINKIELRKKPENYIEPSSKSNINDNNDANNMNDNNDANNMNDNNDANNMNDINDANNMNDNNDANIMNNDANIMNDNNDNNDNNDINLEENEENINYNLEKSYKDEVKSQISEANEIIIFNRKNKIYATELEERDVESEIYPIEEQLISLQDDILASIPMSSRTNKVQNNISITLNRYKQLRENFSTFDEYNIVIGKLKKTAKHKPLSNYFNNFDKQLYWLVPIVTNIKKVYSKNITNDVDSYYKSINLLEDLKEFTEKKQNSNEGILMDETIYNNYNNLVHEYYKPFNNVFDKEDVIVSKSVNNDISVMIDNDKNFKSYVIVNNKITNKPFIFDRYTTGLTQHNTEPKSTDTDNCKHLISKVVNMTPHDIMDITSFISLPEQFIQFSKVNLPSTNILNKSLLNQVFVQYWKIFKDKALLKKYNINLLQNEEELIQKGETNAYMYPPTIFKNAITQYKLNMTKQEIESLNMTKNEIYQKFIDRIIPKTKFIFNMMKEYMNDKVTFYSILQYLEPFLIYSDDITYNQYKGIKYFITKKIKEHNERFIEKRKQFGFFKRNVKNKIDKYIANSLFHLITLDFKFNEDIELDFIDDKVEAKYGIEDYNFFTNSEFYKKLMLKDNLRLYTSVLSGQNIALTYPNNFTPFFQYEKEKLKETNNKETNVCSDIIISKHYSNINKLENDNNRNIIFDRKFDTTNYNLLDEYEKEVNQLSEEALKEYITKDLMKKQTIDKKTAEELMTTLLNGNKLVKPGHYAILEKAEIGGVGNNRYTYYKRNKQNIWEEDEVLNKRQSDLVDPTSLCNVQELCIVSENKTKNSLNSELNMPCNQVTKTKSELKQALLEKMINEFDEKYSKSKKEHEKELVEKIKKNWYNLPKLSKIRIQTKYKYNDYKNNLIHDSEIKINDNKSPYQKTLDLILSIPDIVKKSQYILKFKERFLRVYNPNQYEDSDTKKESEYWLYCNKSNMPILPLFRYEIAKYYLQGYDEYINYINFLKQKFGRISDDGDWWIEKNTNWRIIEIDLDVEEGFENDRKVVTRDVIEEDEGNMITLKKENKMMTQQNLIVLNIINALAISMGINIEKEKNHIINLVDEYIQRNVKPKALYNEENKMKNKKNKPYEEYFNMKLMFFTLSAYLVIVQTMIPQPKTRKTHPGCIRSFSGYPLYEDNDYTMIEYVACIAYDIKTSTAPWNSLNRLKKEAIQKKIKEKIETFLVTNNLIKRRIFQKKQYFVNKALFKTNNDLLDELPEQHKIENWETFLPPLIRYAIKETDNISEIFKTELTKNLKAGSKEQRKQILVIQSKIINYSLLLQKKINNVVMSEEALMYTSKGEKYLENACCNDNLNNTYKYFINKDKNIQKYNKVVKELGQILDDIVYYSKPSLLISKIDTKNKYPMISNTQNQSTIYSAFIHFCRFNFNIPIPTDLQPICHKKPDYNIYLRSDNLFTKIQRLKEDGFEFTLESFLKLMKTVHKNNSIFIDIDREKITPLYQLIRSVENFVNNTDVTNNIFYNNEFIEKIRSVINGAFIDNYFVNYINSNEIQSSMVLNSFLYKNIETMKKDVFNFLKNNSQRSSLGVIKKNMENYNKWRLETSSYEKMNFYKSYIHYFLRIFPLVIKNEQTYKLPNQHYSSFSPNHRLVIDKKVQDYYIELKQFYNMHEIQNILDKVYYDSEHILNIVDDLCCYANIDNLSATLNFETCNLILEYIFINILYQYQELCEEPDMIQTMQKQKDTDFDIDIGIDDIIRGVDDILLNNDDNEIEFNSDILEGNKKNLKEKISSLVLTFMKIYNDHKNIIDKSYDDIQNYIFNLKEKEKNLITDRQEKLEGEEKDVDALMKKHKLGIWGKGLNKGLTQYVKEDYDDERQFRDIMNEIENKMNNKIGVNNDTSGLYDADIFEEYDNILRDKEIEDEEYSMRHIGDDGDILYDNENEDNYDEYDY